VIDGKMERDRWQRYQETKYIEEYVYLFSVFIALKGTKAEVVDELRRG
jgi:hypothetical protein